MSLLWCVTVLLLLLLLLSWLWCVTVLLLFFCSRCLSLVLVFTSLLISFVCVTLVFVVVVAAMLLHWRHGIVPCVHTGFSCSLSGWG